MTAGQGSRVKGQAGRGAVGSLGPRPSTLDCRQDFPILSQRVHGKRLAYLDSAASAQKPHAVLEAMAAFHATAYANIHRGVHTLAERATVAYEGARARVARFVGADDPAEVVFVRGTTEAINLVANSWGAANLAPGDVVLVTELEHHANIVPWQLLAARTGIRLVPCPVTDAGDVDLAAWERLLDAGPVKLAAFLHVSNAIGTVNPAREMAAMARARGARVLVDAAQAVSHRATDVRALGADFLCFSGHKVYGPTGIGALWARRELLEAMPPWQGGGDMIRSVSFAGTTFADPPNRFEAGTPAIAEAVGLAAALDWLEGVGLERVAAHEHALVAEAVERLAGVPGLRLVGTPRERASVVSFVMDGVHPHDIGQLLDEEGVAVRVGHHCAQPAMARFGVPATARASFAAYSSAEDVDQLVGGLARVREVFG
ncbi:MAG TPA: SufS family cysteine desulfurase [Gemmatimonadales bacterium]|nr:SufS family cysteine desulfurase [Gemmatimonadales bacterium]